MEILFFSAHVSMFVSASCIFDWQILKLLPVQIIATSSANRLEPFSSLISEGRDFDRSFIYINHRSGAMDDPCCRPSLNNLFFEVAPLQLTYPYLFESRFLIHLV